MDAKAEKPSATTAQISPEIVAAVTQIFQHAIERFIHEAAAGAVAVGTSSPVAATVGAASALPPLSAETREELTTDQAAFYLGRKANTLRIWACRQNGPIKPARTVHGRLAWKTADVRKLLAPGTKAAA